MTFFKKLFGGKPPSETKGSSRGSEPPNTKSSILTILDNCAEQFTFPVLDNGYVYLAATRLSAFKSQNDWAITIEVFGFNPRAGTPDIAVYTFANQLKNRPKSEDFVEQSAYENFIANNPHNQMKAFFPIDNIDWQDPENLEFVIENKEVILRGSSVSVPDKAALTEIGIDLEEPQILTFEVCRFLAHHFRNRVLATEAERRFHVPDHLEEIVCLDDWVHPNVAGGELPSQVDTFVKLDKLLSETSSEDLDFTHSGNTHWKNWPEGGTL